MLETANDHDQQDLASLRSWLVAMLERPGVADLRRALLMLLDKDLVAVFRPRNYPVFVIDARDKDDIDVVLDTLDNEVQIALLSLCANRDVCFRPAMVNGRPDLKFIATMYELPSWNCPAKRLYPCGGEVQ